MFCGFRGFATTSRMRVLCLARGSGASSGSVSCSFCREEQKGEKGGKRQSEVRWSRLWTTGILRSRGWRTGEEQHLRNDG